MSLFSLFKTINSKKPPTCTAVIVAAGLSQRCEGEDKLFYRINDRPVLAYTISAFQSSEMINDIIVVTHEDKINLVGEMCLEFGFNKVSQVIVGGKTRSESVLYGIYAASKKARLIAIHDGARPCVDVKTIKRTILKAAKYNAAAPAVSITSTIKKVENEAIAGTVDREGLFEIQTPQIFRAELIKAALTKAIKKEIPVTDDCMAVEKLGFIVHVVEGSRKNIKITDKTDLSIVEAILSKTVSKEEGSQCE